MRTASWLLEHFTALLYFGRIPLGLLVRISRRPTSNVGLRGLHAFAVTTWSCSRLYTLQISIQKSNKYAKCRPTFPL